MQQHLAPSRPTLAPRPSSPGVTSPAAPLAPFPPLAAKSRAPEIYGFVAWTGTLLGYALFLAWALLPPRALDALGWTWYPAQEWAVLVPAWSVMLILLTYAAYLALALARTPAFNEVCTVTDARAHYLTDATVRDVGTALMSPDNLPVPYDIPIGIVNRRLYSKPLHWQGAVQASG